MRGRGREARHAVASSSRTLRVGRSGRRSVTAGRWWRPVAAAWLAIVAGCCHHASAASRHPSGGPFVFAHRGASGERPEHTLAAYALAIDQGADYVEPDLRPTKDGVLVCLHDATLERTTDVADRPEFASRVRTDDKGRRRWHLADFTLAEVKTLRTRQGTAGRSRDFDGRESIPTFAEAVVLVRAHNARRADERPVGLAPEIKDGDADAFVTAVRVERLEEPGGVPLHVQSFDLDTVLAVRPRLASPCVWLLSRRPTAAEIADLADRIDGFSIAKQALLADDAPAFVAGLHDRGFCVVSWTFADDRHDGKRFSSPAAELAVALGAGIDAFFTDFPASGVAARAAHGSPRRRPSDTSGADR